MLGDRLDERRLWRSRPASSSSVKIGVSLILQRIYTPTSPTAMPNRRQAPPQVDRIVWRQHRIEQRRGQRAEQEPARDPDQLERAEKAAPVLRRVFDDIGARPAELAAGGEALEQPDDDQERRADPGLGVGREEAHREGRHRHHEDDRGQRFAPAAAVAVDAEDDRAHGRITNPTPNTAKVDSSDTVGRRSERITRR